MISSRAFTASQITYNKSFSNPLGISTYTVSSWRGAPLSEHVQSPFVLMSELEATQRGVKRGKKLRQYVTWPWAFSRLFFFSERTSASAVTTRMLLESLQTLWAIVAPHSVRGNFARKSANGCSATSYTVQALTVTQYVETKAGTFHLYLETKLQIPWCVQCNNTWLTMSKEPQWLIGSI